MILGISFLQSNGHGSRNASELGHDLRFTRDGDAAEMMMMVG